MVLFGLELGVILCCYSLQRSAQTQKGEREKEGE